MYELYTVTYDADKKEISVIDSNHNVQSYVGEKAEILHELLTHVYLCKYLTVHRRKNHTETPKHGGERTND